MSRRTIFEHLFQSETIDNGKTVIAQSALAQNSVAVILGIIGIGFIIAFFYAVFSQIFKDTDNFKEAIFTGLFFAVFLGGVFTASYYVASQFFN